MATRWWKHFEDMITRFDIIHERDIQQRDRLTLHDGRGCVYHDLCIASRGKNELASRLRSVQVGGRNKRSWHYTDKKHGDAQSSVEPDTEVISQVGRSVSLHLTRLQPVRITCRRRPWCEPNALALKQASHWHDKRFHPSIHVYFRQKSIVKM